MEYLTSVMALTLPGEKLAIQDPLAPSRCPVCFWLLADELSKVSDMKSLRQDEECQGFFTACIALLCAPRSQSEQVALKDRLRQNSIACDECGPFPFRAMPFQDPLLLLVDALCRAVAVAYPMDKETMSPTRRRDATHAFRLNARSNLWPVSEQQLFPFGPREGVLALVDWMCMFMSPFPALVMLRFSTAANRLILPYIYEEPIRAKFVSALTRMLHEDPWASITGWPNNEPPVAPGTPREHARWPGKADRMAMAASILDALLMGSANEVLSTFTRGYEQAMFTALRNAIPHFEKSNWTLRPLMTWGVFLQQRLRLPEDTLGPHAHEFIVRMKNEQDAMDLLPELLLVVLRMRRETSRCSNASCTVHEYELDNTRRFQNCGRCKSARYCGRDCQMEDWRVGIPCPYPWAQGVSVRHQLMCPILARVNAVTDFSSVNKAEFSTAFHSLGLTDIEAANLVDWIVACRMVVPQTVLKITPFGTLVRSISVVDFDDFMHWIGLGDDPVKRHRLPSNRRLIANFMVPDTVQRLGRRL